MLPPVVLSPEVADALEQGRAVVALETAIVTHGLPFPANLTTARAVERVVREAGATPATIGVVTGRVHVGLPPALLERLASEPEAAKVQARGLPLALARGVSGGTTVSATMHVASACGIRVFATGGVGGVHRQAARTADVSEDLLALAQQPIAVVSSGAKAILDLPATVEALETLGVPVVGFRTKEFPGFYHSATGLAIPEVETAADVAAIMHAAWGELAFRRGVLVCQPPPEDEALPGDEVERWIQEALADASTHAVSGPALTPYLLEVLDRRSGGATVRTNVALVTSNARLAAQIAQAFVAEPERRHRTRPPGKSQTGNH